MRLRLVTSKIAALVAGAALISAAAGPPGAVAIVVNKGNSVETLSAKELKQIFTGEKTHWMDGQKIQTLATGAATPEHKVAIQFLFGMNEADYQKYCLHATFAGTARPVPMEAATSQAVLNYVALIPGAIGFIRADLASPNAKVIKVDGMAPGDPGYPIEGAK